MISRANILNARILVADDSAVNVSLLDQILREAGYTAVTLTTDPRAVAGLYREHRHDLILLDLLMPVMDGFEVMQELTTIEDEGYLPVLVLTAQPSLKVRALQMGAKDFVAKPFDRLEVLTRIHNMLEVRLLLRESRTYGQWLELYDPLTGLPNRTQYRQLLTRALQRPAALAGIVSVVFVAIDQFQNVNDALGRGSGDALLRLVGDRLAGCIGPLDTVARLDSELFGLIVSAPGTDAAVAGSLATTMRECLRSSFVLDGTDVAITASIGIASSPADSSDPDELMRSADTALHNAKGAGGDRQHFYSDAMNRRARETLDIEVALRHALERDEFVLHYQPKMRVDTGAWTGVEALLRWNRPGHGLTPPAGFIAVLEETGLIVPVGAWVIDTACRQVGAWARDGMENLQVAVNVSEKQFLRDGFVRHCARAISENAIPPDSLHIEITESSLMSRIPETDEVLKALKALGVWIAIDDFGTGYSSLAYLKRFPIDALKIDISFIRDVITSADGAAITVAIINLARSLRMTVIAEGVETETQLDFLRRHACDEIQGFYCSKPLPAAELAALRTVTGSPRATRTNG